VREDFLLLCCDGSTINEAPRSKLRGIKAELRRSQPAYAQLSFGVISHSSLQQATGYSGEGE